MDRAGVMLTRMTTEQQLGRLFAAMDADGSNSVTTEEVCVCVYVCCIQMEEFLSLLRTCVYVCMYVIYRWKHICHY